MRIAIDTTTGVILTWISGMVSSRSSDISDETTIVILNNNCAERHMAFLLDLQLHRSYCSGLTKFPDFSSIFLPFFQYFFNVLFVLSENLSHFSK